MRPSRYQAVVNMVNDELGDIAISESKKGIPYTEAEILHLLVLGLSRRVE